MKREAQVMKALYEAMTTPDSEDWLMLVCDGTVLLTALREIDGKTHLRSGELTVAEFKATVEALPVGSQLGLVGMYLGTDAEQHGGVALLEWLQLKAGEKGFTLISTTGEAPTVTIRERMRSWVLEIVEPGAWTASVVRRME